MEIIILEWESRITFKEKGLLEWEITINCMVILIMFWDKETLLLEIET